MTKFKTQGFRRTFKNARKGLRIVLKSERNIRIHFLAGTLALLTGVVLDLTPEQLCLMLLVQVVSAERPLHF